MRYLQRRLRLFALLLLPLVIAACGGDDGTGPDDDDDLQAQIIGTWKVMKSNGVDISGMNGTFTVTATTITENWPGICSKAYSYTLSGNRIDTTVTSNSCTFDGANEPVGSQSTATIVLNGNKLTLTVPSTGAVAELQRV